MARKLASIQIITELQPIPNSDFLELASVLGWKCVTKKGEHKVGDKVIYFEIDSFLPIKPEYEFLRKSCYKKFTTGEEGFRIKTIRLRGSISQGLILPAGEYSELPIGSDVTEQLGIVKYDPPIPACLKGTVKGQFPTFIPKTDETRVQVLQNVLTRHKGLECYITEKFDGASVTYYLKDGEFGVCSRNLELLETPDNSFWKVARELKIEEKLRLLNHNIALQGELVGPSIQENPLKLKSATVFFFNVFNIDEYRYLDYEQFVMTITQMELQTVPILSTSYVLEDNVDILVTKSMGKSMINPDGQREGIVIRPMKEKVDLEMSTGFNNARLSFKAINPEYLLQEE